ncbi:MAG: hypothetical protein KDA27_27250, partial [Candidatus Eisenbacteria bacterium]|nr:hypothetical protein [Candidatus Eisenbacteria bacterium]
QRNRVLLSFLAMTCLGTTSWAATLTVGGGGTYATIQAAVTAATSGDTIEVAPGTYVENVNINKNLALVSTGGRAATTIEGVSMAGSLGTIVVTNNTTGVTIGGTGAGFTIIGIDNGAPGIENAAVYFQGSHSNALVRDNEIVADGDAGLQTEYGATIDAFVIDGNEFSGSTFFDPPAGEGFGSQFSLPNVPRQLVVIGCGGGCTNTTNVQFTNNLISGTAGGINTSSQEQGNNLVTVDGQGTVVTGNSFVGTTTRYATSLRCRGASTTISGNDFSSAGLADLVGHVEAQNTGSDLSTIVAANTFDRSVWVNGASGTIGHKIQPFVAAVPAGTTINVGPGDYPEQIEITSNIILQGDGAGSTTIQCPSDPLVQIGTRKPIVGVNGALDARIQGLTVDGLGLGNGNNSFVGVSFWNGGGKLLDCDVVSIRDNPLSGVQHGVAVYSYNDTPGSYALEVGNCTITDFQKNAFALSGDGMVVDVHDCTVTGAGDFAVTAQNGIQVSFGAGGSITDCDISAMRYTPADYVASGILTYQCGSNVTLTGGTITSDVQAPVSWYDTSGAIDGVEVGGNEESSVYIYNSSPSLTGDPNFVARSPFEESTSGGESRPTAAAHAVSVLGTCMTGMDVPGTAGVVVNSGGGPLTVTMQNASIKDFDYGIYTIGAAAVCNVTSSSITSNVTAGYDNTAGGASQLASFNWWGDASGPSGDGSGSGDAVLGGNVTFSPWLLDGTSSSLCGFFPTSTTEVAPVDPGVCSNATQPCVPVDIDITRADNADVRGFSVDVQLTNLMLCGAGITEGTYLNSISGTAYQVLNNGGGSYTIDCAILGSPCGQDAATGTLFTMNVQGVSPGTGTIEVTDVTLRDCTNGPVAGGPGAALDLTVDTSGPSPVANLSTTQLKTGNDMDGTTKVLVTFAAPGDAVVTKVYRAPYLDSLGDNAYPEYNDVAGGPPSIPTYPPSGPWVDTGLSGSGQYDEPTERGYWYYVVFTQDECLNWSAVSNMTDGVLNYHLGDVTDGVTNGDGDNKVNTADISHLGD